MLRLKRICVDGSDSAQTRFYEHPRLGEIETRTLGSVVRVRPFFDLTPRDIADAARRTDERERVQAESARRMLKASPGRKRARQTVHAAGEATQKELAL